MTFSPEGERQMLPMQTKRMDDIGRALAMAGRIGEARGWRKSIFASVDEMRASVLREKRDFALMKSQGRD